LLIPPAIRARIRTECKYPVVVKVFDTAFLIDHQDMQKGQLPGKNYTSDPNGPDIHGHGTHVAGIIGCKTLGIAWDLVDIGLLRIQPTQVLNQNGSGNFNGIASAETSELTDAKQRIAAGERVIHNYSLGGGTALVPNVEAALKASSEAGVVHVAAAGNNGGAVIYPAISQYMIAVSAFDQGQNLAGFSSRGPLVETSKPGVAIFAAYKNNTYATLSGTSMAAPFMAGAIAIAMSKWAQLKNIHDVRAYLEKVATDLGAPGRDDLFGWGVLFIQAILDTAPDGGDPPPPSSSPAAAAAPTAGQ
jgi:subtilisin family serine protease